MNLFRAISQLSSGHGFAEETVFLRRWATLYDVWTTSVNECRIFRRCLVISPLKHFQLKFIATAAVGHVKDNSRGMFLLVLALFFRVDCVHSFGVNDLCELCSWLRVFLCLSGYFRQSFS